MAIRQKVKGIEAKVGLVTGVKHNDYGDYRQIKFLSPELTVEAYPDTVNVDGELWRMINVPDCDSFHRGMNVTLTPTTAKKTGKPAWDIEIDLDAVKAAPQTQPVSQAPTQRQQRTQPQAAEPPLDLKTAIADDMQKFTRLRVQCYRQMRVDLMGMARHDWYEANGKDTPEPTIEDIEAFLPPEETIRCLSSAVYISLTRKYNLEDG